MNRSVPGEPFIGEDPVPHGLPQCCPAAVESREQLEEVEGREENQEDNKDGFHTSLLRRSGAFRARSYTTDSFKRHSWGPGKEFQDPISRRRLQSSECPGSQEAPFLQSLEELGTPLGAQQQEQQQGQEQQRGQPFHRGQSFCYPSAAFSVPSVTGMLSKAVSMSDINLLSDCSDPNGNSPQSYVTDLSKCGKQLEEDSGTWAGSSLRRTFSFLLGMTGRDKTREKEKMKEAKDARYTNGHLFTTISVSGMTMCYACNKSITAKEALICPTCNVTIHNRCKDTLANCTKVKQKQQKAALLRNNTALQSVSLRSKTTTRVDRKSVV